MIAQRKWREGFRYHDASLGGPNRDRHRYGNAPDWDGDEQIDGDIVIYGEQGLGDEVMLASCIPDAIKETDGNNLILNVDHRLANLFRRSFPQVQAVYGDRHRFPNIRWDKHHKITAQAALGQLQTFYRKTDADFPGKPYLIPDPDRMAAYGGLIQRISPDGEPIVGIAWQGGKPHAAERSERSLELEDFLPLIDPEKSGIYAHWFVLEYVDVNKEVDDFKRAHPELASRVHYFPWILRSSDYDDTAALTALLDSVVTVPTTILHLAGALGIDCHVLLPIVPHWRFGYDPAWKDFPWHKSVHLFRRESGEHKALAIERFVKEQGQSIGRQFSPFFNGQVAEAGQSK